MKLFAHVCATGAANFMGRLFSAGVALPVFKGRVLLALAINILATGITVIFLVNCQSMNAFMVVSAIFGLLTGPSMAQATTFLREVVTQPHFDLAYGIDIGLYGLTSFVGPWVVETLVEACGNYYMPFYMAAVMFFISALLNVCAHFMRLLDLHAEKC